MKLINVDDIKWQEGVFINPITGEPLPIIHKVATIEMLRDWQEGVNAIPLDKVKQAREKIAKVYPESIFDHDKALRTTLQIIDELIAESEGVNDN